MDQEIVALIPVREGSQRVKNKNFRPFANEKSLMHLKIRLVRIYIRRTTFPLHQELSNPNRCY